MEREHRLAGLVARLQNAGAQTAQLRESQLVHLEERVHRSSGLERVARFEYMVDGLADRMHRGARSCLSNGDSAVANLEARLMGADPTAPLGRGFCLVRPRGGQEGSYVHTAGEVAAGEGLELLFRDGAVDATAQRVRPGEGLPAWDDTAGEGA
jgi:exonuclease VII large subunit